MTAALEALRVELNAFFRERIRREAMAKKAFIEGGGESPFIGGQ